jgi:hypothetical protein
MTVCGSARRTARTADSGKLRIGETEHEGESSLHTREASDDLLVDGRAATRRSKLAVTLGLQHAWWSSVAARIWKRPGCRVCRRLI